MKKLLLAAICLCFLHISPAAAQWQWLNPKPNTYSGQAIRFVNPNRGFVLQELGQLLRTDDAGLTWREVARYPDAADLEFAHDGTGYLLTHPGVLWRSTDGGQTWARVSRAPQTAPQYVGYGPPVVQHYYTRLHAISADTVVELTNNGLLRRSVDGGRQWQETATGVQVLSSFFVSGKVGFMGTWGGKIYKTTNGGTTWTKLSEVTYIPSEITMLHFISPLVGFAHREHSDLLRTSDGGLTWTVVSNRLEDINEMHFLSSSVGFAVGDYGTIYSTATAGLSWTAIGPAATSGLIAGNNWRSVYFTSPATGYVTGQGNKGPIMRTVDGGQTWLPLGPLMGNINALVFPGQGLMGYALSTNGLLHTTDGGDNWGLRSPMSGTVLACPDASTLIAVNGNISRSVDGGLTWTSAAVPGRYNGTTVVSTLSMANAQVGFAAGSDGVNTVLARTIDGARTWQVVNGSYSQGLRKLAFVSPTTGFAIGYNDLYKTTDSGLSWQPVRLGQYGTPSDVAFVDAQVGYALDEYATIYKTTDGGSTWTPSQLNRSRPYAAGHTLRLHFFDRDNGCVQDDAGSIFRTADGGRSWIWERNLGSQAMAYTHGGQSLVLGGGNGMLVRRSLATTPWPFRAEVLPPAVLTDSSAVLAGTLISTNCIVDSARFEYGLASAPGFSKVAAAYPTLWYGSDSLRAQVPSGLLPATTYRVRIRMVHNGNAYYSAESTFATPMQSVLPTPELAVYPNPTSGYLRVVAPGSRGTARIEVFSLQGTRVRETTDSGVDLAGLHSGIYILWVHQGEQVYRRRIMKQ
ncbi:T9SS type A sorting domain-containing protein [Microvirga sp. STS02]|uniref:YCF48-related protein n=1 Tax=Hymenobacter negativus TaxID=2795026 RepID=UPI0018DD5F14|nr:MULTISPECIES: YCF48-related protein [Bacteria]MBH8569423.1 T9SS type A sorting domain-containing protein [Hymenobacter negativus]MBR7209159.1 T9SS type A sorting domain-containing protein [Microvirga sp. STS02]